MTVTLDPALPAADAGVVADGRQAGPEVPERARRRTSPPAAGVTRSAAAGSNAAARPGGTGREAPHAVKMSHPWR
jgi:hypothetical protein